MNNNLPFEEIKIGEQFVRTFSENTSEELFVWHRDKEDRIIKCEHNTNWKFQRDNELPINFDKEIFIKSNVYHRLIKGSDNLILKITKL